ncbi:hypothetical protein C809_03933 [Lachnospiraceae bacterium MD335]|nr:hypothetical protein C809_03933 [Lachnospiraceae bacterium MD335]
MLQKGFDLLLIPSIGETRRRIFEDKEIEPILCDVDLPDSTAMELFHALRRVAGMFQMKNPLSGFCRSLSSPKTTTLPRNMNTSMRV